MFPPASSYKPSRLFKCPSPPLLSSHHIVPVTPPHISIRTSLACDRFAKLNFTPSFRCPLSKSLL
ncbi:hypothetical protein OF83DRAFT_1091757 [Amylostereum chailletii]|nr:hypothetical protein OF83DRAFT_1091757 [Amylostereum chailletii]